MKLIRVYTAVLISILNLLLEIARSHLIHLNEQSLYGFFELVV